jgi:predicted acyl esterase
MRRSWSGRHLVLAILVTSLAGVLPTTGNVAAVAAGSSVVGSIPMSDGVELHYSLVVPGPGAHPVALTYTPYSEGSDAVGLAPELLAAG